MTKGKASFWMLWNEKRELPAMKHTILKLALAEGRRLSEKQPGDIFYLLQAVKIFFKPAKTSKQGIFKFFTDKKTN